MSSKQEGFGERLNKQSREFSILVVGAYTLFLGNRSLFWVSVFICSPSSLYILSKRTHTEMSLYQSVFETTIESCLVDSSMARSKARRVETGDEDIRILICKQEGLKKRANRDHLVPFKSSPTQIFLKLASVSYLSRQLVHCPLTPLFLFLLQSTSSRPQSSCPKGS